MDVSSLKEKQVKFHQTVESLNSKLPDESSTRKQLENHKELFDDAINYVKNQSHKIAFIGNIGTGKTTAICHSLGLLDGKDPILSTGSGRTTLCEVEIVSSSSLSIEITPHTNEEVESYLTDFSQYLLAKDLNEEESSDSFKLSAEVERALRNMLDLRASRVKNSEGKRVTIDKAKEFASNYESVKDLSESLLGRIKLTERTKTFFTNDTELPQNEWLHNTFKSINSGTNTQVGLAKRILISVPKNLFEGIDYNLSVIDTKGVDQTVNRSDLDKCLTDNRTISVICCRFNEAPDKTMSGLLTLAKSAGLGERISKETVLLVLDRDEEAENVIDIDEPVGDKEEGREIRSEQMLNDIKHTLQLDNLDVHFMNVKSDSTKNLSQSLKEKVTHLRNLNFQTISETESAVRDIESELKSQSAKAAKIQVRNTLAPWLKKARNSNPQLKEYFLPLINDIRNKGTYASSIRASVNRHGEWHNLDYYQLLASSARQQVVDQIGKNKDELIVLIDNMLSQNELQPAYALLKQIKQTTEKRLGEIYQQAFSKGRSVYDTELSNDSALWGNLANEWGKGSGYKDRVSSGSANWFQTHRYPEHENQVTDKAATAWQRYVNEVSQMLGN